MRFAWTLAVALAVAVAGACASPGRAPRDVARPRPELVPLSRAMVAIDQLAERGGEEIRIERKERSRAADQDRFDVSARFLAVWAQPRGEERWAGFKGLAREFPESALGQVGMASVYVEWRTLDQADKALALALDVEPDNWIAVLFRAAAAERRERWEFAAIDYRTVLAADPGNPEAHLGLARLARREGDAARVRQEAHAALAAAPGHLGALRLLADLATAAGDDAEATAIWAQVVEANPRDRGARLRLANLYRAAGKPGLAMDQLKAAVSLGEDAETLGLLAAAARAARDLRTEIEAVERLSGLDPSAAEWVRIGQMRLEYGDLDGAEKAFRKALARDPRDPAANAGVGRVLLRRGDSLGAVEALRAAGDAGKAELAPLERRLHLDRLARRDVAQLQKAVQALVDQTFRARAAVVRSLSGSLKLRVTVNPAGEATQVELLEDTVHDADVRACAYWNLRDAAYPQNRPGRLTFGFAFTKR